MRCATASVVLLALLAGCASAPWPSQSVGAFRLHVAPGDAWMFQDLANETRTVGAAVATAVGPPPGPIDVYAYGPDPPRDGGPPAKAMFLRSHLAPPATIYLASLPSPLWGTTLRPVNASGSLLHELVHVSQHEGLSHPAPPWLLEGGASLMEAPDPATWAGGYLDAAHALAAAPIEPTFDAFFAGIHEDERQLVRHQGGAMALWFLSARCDLGDPPWVPLLQAIRDGRADSEALRDRCRGVGGQELVSAFHGWLLDEVRALAGSRPPQPPGDVVASTVYPDSLVDACGAWFVHIDYTTSRLTRLAGPDLDLGVAEFPLSVGCDAHDGVAVLGYGRLRGATISFIDAAGRSTGAIDGPRPVSAISWDAARDDGWYWGLVEGAPALQHVTRHEVRAAPTSHGMPAGRIAFSRDGKRAVFAVQGDDNVTRTYESDATDPLSTPKLLVEGARAAWFGPGDVLWMTRRATTAGIEETVGWENGTLSEPVLRSVGRPWPGDDVALVPWTDGSGTGWLVAVRLPETFLSQSGPS